MKFQVLSYGAYAKDHLDHDDVIACIKAGLRATSVRKSLLKTSNITTEEVPAHFGMVNIFAHTLALLHMLASVVH